MALQITDGFDMYNGSGANTGFQAKWSGASGNADATVTLATGRFGGQCFQVVGQTNARRMWSRSFTAIGSVASGFAFRSSVLPPTNNPLMYLRAENNATFQLVLVLLPTGALQVGRVTNGFGLYTALATSAAAVIAANTFHFIEFEAVIDDAAGSFKVWVDNLQVINATAVDTRSNLNGNVATVDTIWLGTDGGNPGPVATYSFDDFYVNNTNARIGELRIETLRPDADTVTKAFTPDSGTANYSRVNETLVNGDTSFVQSSAVNDRDLYSLGDLSSSPGNIYGINVVSFAEKTDATARSIYNSIQSNGVDSDGAALALAAAYGRFDRILETDPSGGGAWTTARINALLAGIKIAA